jgi:hypothetical protein
MNYFLKPGFINWHLASSQLLDFLGIIIDAYDVMPDIGETGASHQAYITGTDDCKIHD